MPSQIANVVDLINRTITLAELSWTDGKITEIKRLGNESTAHPYLIPGFIDAHVHIESAMLVPSEFARMALKHGTLAAVADPHEIANVMGEAGIDFMLEDAAKVPFYFLFGAPSCVPATPFETAGAEFDSASIEKLFSEKKAGYLSEVMNYPGVLNRQKSVMEKIRVAQRFGVTVDGHAPGLTAGLAAQYAQAGIKTDHECTSLEEALDKIRAGMTILIREGSAANDFETLHCLISEFPERVMFCSDDKHPDDLTVNHIGNIIRQAIQHGHDKFDVLRAASFNPVKHYGLAMGLLQLGDNMDALLIDNLADFSILEVFVKGESIVKNGKCALLPQKITPINKFNTREVTPGDFNIPAQPGRVKIIVAHDGQLHTDAEVVSLASQNGYLLPDLHRDIAIIAVHNRYSPSRPAVAMVKGFGLKHGAIASSVAHDSHNIVAVGTSADAISNAINAVVNNKGGLAVANGGTVQCLPLPIAGLMSDQPGEWVAEQYHLINQAAKDLGSHLRTPFMTLSFMALLVIPSLKLSDKGLFDGDTFKFTSLFVRAAS